MPSTITNERDQYKIAFGENEFDNKDNNTTYGLSSETISKFNLPETTIIRLMDVAIEEMLI